ncbi:DsbA family oxidoreductase [Solicola sp. PLA-1-18]|uniref:DsbA family oxidoreductase n=1 Tax=Solicola sp. PLA-1-18 TaxID=3380532 RepID=UPI003B795FFD
MNPTVKVDIWSDVACPWCYIGKRKFEEGVRRYATTDGSADVEVEYHSFELAPDTPVDSDGSEVDFLAHHKGMDAAQVQQMLTQVGEIAASVGLDYDFDALRHTKTLKAHELLHHAKAHGLQEPMKERLLKAYFEQGRHVGRVDDLVALATDVGLDADEARAALEDGRYAGDVQADIDQARAYGINGVPFFVVDGRYGVSGAQDPDTFAQALATAVADRTEAQS